MNIYKAIAAVMADVQSVAKKDRNDHQRFNFRGIDAVVNAVGPALRKHGVVVVPWVESATYAMEEIGSKRTPMCCCRIVAEYRFYAEDGSSLAVKVAGEAMDSGDKATPKAMSVAFRTALLQALALPTDEPDPDHDTYERAPQSAKPAAPADGLNELRAAYKECAHVCGADEAKRIMLPRPAPAEMTAEQVQAAIGSLQYAIKQATTNGSN